MIFDYLIIGGGIAGVTTAKILKQKGFKVSVIEEKSVLGGLVHCSFKNGHLFHRVGGHVFNAKDENVRNWFWSHFDKEGEFLAATRKSKILLPDYSMVDYPIENHIYQLDESVGSSILRELTAINQKSPAVHQITSFRDFLLNNFGKTLYEIYFGPYNDKIWQYDLSEMPLEWLEGKLPMPSYSSILENNIYRKQERSMVHSTFYYPVKGGSQFIIDRLSEGIDCKLGIRVNKIERLNSYWHINGMYQSKEIVYTGDIRRLNRILRLESDSLDLEKLVSLPSHGTSNLLCECDITDLSWLYLSSPHILAHRIIYTGNFSPYNNGPLPNNRITCTVEFSGEVDLPTMLREIKKLPGNLVYLDHNYEPNSYIIHNLEARKKVNSVRESLKLKGIHLIGRFAEWEYYNMDKVIEKALNYFQTDEI